MKKQLLILVIAILIIVIVRLSGYNETNQNFEEVTNEENNIGENYNPFYCKKVILRDDDIAGLPQYLPGLKWISNLAVNKDIKITLSIIPEALSYDFETVNYLNQLNREYFEFATHGYIHERFLNVSYEQQYSLIENGTKNMEEYLHYKPFTFMPPYDSCDINTSKALAVFSYHTIMELRDNQSYVVSFFTDFEYEAEWDPVRHYNFEEFKSSFDTFYNSSNEYYFFLFHDWTFLDEEGKINQTEADGLENIIDYIKNKNVQFMTIDEAYRRQKDDNVIKTGKINENSFYINLEECFYNHSIKINPPSNWDKDIYIKDETTGKTTVLVKEKFEFQATKGHYYTIDL